MNKIIKISLLISSVGFLFFIGCKKNKPPETPDKPSGPTIISANQTKQYTTRAHDSNRDDEIRYIFDWDDGKLDTTDYFLNDSTASATHAWSSTGNFELKVKAQDEKNALTINWSDELRVTVVTNHSPSKPLTPIGLNLGRTNIKYTFKTVIEDPDGDSVSAKFDWGNNRVLTWTPFYASGDTIQDTITYSDSGTFAIKVIATDNTGNSSEWSDADQFVVSPNHNPNQPLTPIGFHYGVSNRKCTFQTVVYDPDGDEISVKFNWGNGRTPIWTNFYPSGDTIKDTVTFSDTGTFSIKVVAQDIFIDTSVWSNTFQFRVMATNNPPDKPLTPIGPSSGGIYRRFTFKTSVLDSDNDSVAVKFDWGNGRTQTWTRFYSSGDTIRDTITYLNPGNFSIKVLARDNLGDTSEWSDICQFMVFDEGYIEAVFQATTRPHEGEVDTVGMQSSPAIATVSNVEEIFIGSEGGQLYRITASTMDRDYYKYPDQDPLSQDDEPWGNTPAVNAQADHWYIADDQGEFYCWTLGGNLVWRYPGIGAAQGWNFTHWDFTDAAFNSSNGYVYVVNRDWDSLYVLNDASGSKVGYYSGFGLTTAPTLDAQGNVYIGDDSGYVYKFSPTAGTPVWKHKLNGSVSTSAIIDAAGIIYVCTNLTSNGYLYALNSDSTIKWIYTIGEKTLSPPVIGTDNNIYFCDDWGRIHAVDALTGTLKTGWSLINIGPGGSSPAFASDGYFYIINEGCHVFCINSVDGSIRWETPLPIFGKSKFTEKREDIFPSSVIGSDGDIFVSCGRNVWGLYKIHGRNTGIPANTPWPMYRHDRNHSGKAGFVPGR